MVETNAVTTGATGVALGSRHTCALNGDGTVLCWGANDSGQLGNGEITENPTPTPKAVPGLTGVIAIAAGGAFTCAARAEGGVLCWGRNVDGELGLGTGSTADPQPTPQSVALLANVGALTARDRHACALTMEGRVWCWGSNVQGELGDGTSVARREPTEVALPSDVWMNGIAAGAAHTCALGNGQVWCWGSNQLGELGDGTNQNRFAPAGPLLSGVGDIAAAGHHTCARASNGTVWCWGANQAGQLGEGTTSNIDVPVPVTGIDDAAEVTTGDAFSCARRRNGTVWCWGDDRVGQLGTGAPIESPSPIPVVALDRAQAITAGGSHTCALRPSTNGAINTVCWGDNQAGQLGDGTRLDRSVPAGLKIGLNASEITAGALHTCLRGGDKSVWCWGRGGSGQLGTSLLIDAAVPVTVAGFTGATRIAASRAHTCVIRQDVPWCWGANDEGQLGDGTTVGRSTPTAVSQAAGVIDLALGGAHTCALRSDGTVVCWGRGTEGQLGDGLMTNSAIPVVVPDLSNAVAIVAGDRHTCARTAADGNPETPGEVLCWGEGKSGQLGWGSLVGHKIPSAVRKQSDGVLSGILSGIVEIAAGDNHTCARVAPGSVVCWGDNGAGQLGDGTHNIQAAAPIIDGNHPAADTNALAIAAGGAHTCAIQADRTVVCWGSDSAGQLGDGAILPYPIAQPTHVACP